MSATFRLKSLDALRGFDMLWIMGIPGIIYALNTLIPGCGGLEWLEEQMHHVSWDGLHLMDLVFPVFLFIAGVSFPFSYEARRRKGQSMGQIYRHVFQRAIVLVAIGIVYNGGLSGEWSQMRVASVLGRIGLSWMVGALLFIHLRRFWGRVAMVACMLWGYALLITCVKAPDAAADVSIWSKEGSIVGWFDRMFLPGRIYYGMFDPENLLGIVPASAMALMGMMVGEVFQTGGGRKKGLIGLLIVGVGLLVLGVLFSSIHPINKKLWTSTFAMVASGIAILLLLLFYWIIDHKGWSRWAYPLEVIGRNSLTIYLAQAVISFKAVATMLLGAVALTLPEQWGDLLLSVTYVALCWLLLYYLDRKKIYLKV